MHPVLFKKLEMRKLKASEIILKEGQEPFKLHSVIPNCLKNSVENFGKGYIPNQNFGTFLRDYLFSEFKTIFYLNLKIYSNIYGICFQMLCDDLCASGKVHEAT